VFFSSCNEALRDRAVKTGRAEAETLCNDQWMDVGSRPTFFVLIIVSIQVQCRNELNVTLFSHDRRLVFKRSKNLRQMGAMTCCDLGLHLILPQ